jgi:serine/threonine protein kinase
MRRDDLELYAMGEYEGDVTALEDELAGDDAARAIVADEARFELLLRDAAVAATFCPACDDLVPGARCNACGAAVRPGGYVVERVLVSNAHGRMYAARDADGKQVALKELAFVQSPTVEVIAAFEREVKFLRALDHPAIPRFCASFEEGTGVHVRYYLAQELVTGESLAERLDAHFYSEAEIVGIACQVLDVLVYLQGLTPMVIHRDIKPANLVVRADGALAVVDFGAAHVQGMTVGSTAIGTFGYMPIEQLAGEVDATTDPYALGASLLHLVTRKEPWRILHGGTLAGLELNLSRPMRAWLGKLVAPQPRDRFRSAAEARAALDRLAGGRRRTRSALARMPTRLIRRGLLAATAVAALGVIGVSAMEWLDLEPSWFEAPEPVEARLPADNPRRSAYEASASAQLAWLSALRDLACRCTDKRCIDDITEKINRWTNERTADAMRMSLDAGKRTAEVSAGLSRCLARVLREVAHADQPIRQGAAGDPAPAGAPAPGGPGPGHRRVELDVKEMFIHDAVLAIAEACDLTVVLSVPVADRVRVQRSPIPCDRVLETLMKWTRLERKHYKLDWSGTGVGDRGIYRIAAPTDTMLERLDREARIWAGDNSAGLPLGETIDIKFHQAPLRDVIQWLAKRGHIDIAISDSMNSMVTVYARNESWDRLMLSALDATHLGFHYDPATRRLEVPPPGEPHR